MIPLTVKVPFAGEAVSVFKTACDFIIHSEEAGDRLTPISDNEYKFSESITLGVFRLLLDGTLTTVDKDLDNLVSLMTLSAKDRGGKGKVDAKLRLFISQDTDLICEAEIETKGMLSRVELPIEKVFGDKIQAILELAIIEATNEILVEDIIFGDEDDYKKPLWVLILQFPANLISWPLSFLRKLVLA